MRSARVTWCPPGSAGRCRLSKSTSCFSEIDPPQGDEPVEWILVTTLPIDTEEDVRKIIQYYTVRWMIEVLFRTRNGLPRGGPAV